MAQYMVINEHAPDECGAIEAAIPKLLPELKGGSSIAHAPAVFTATS